MKFILLYVGDGWRGQDRMVVEVFVCTRFRIDKSEL